MRTATFKCFLSLTFSLLYSVGAFGQSAKAINKPVEYTRPDGKLLESHESKIPKKGDLWTVFSDRNDNTVYDSPNGTNETGKINFGEMFYVTGVKGEYLELYNMVDGKPKGKVGWIHQSKVLLWNNAIRNKGFTIKLLAMIQDASILKSREKLEKYLSRENEGSVFCYNRPAHEAQFMSKTKLGLFQLMYKFKEENNMYLVGVDARFTSYSTFNIIGWVPKEVVTEWDSRLTIEPNYSANAKTERDLKNVSMPVFREENKTDATAFAKEGSPARKEAIYGTKKEYNATLAEEMRMPLLDGTKGFDTKSSLYHVGYISPFFRKNKNSGSEGDFEARGLDSLKRTLDQAMDRERQVNFVFLVDGSTVMKPVMEEVKRAIQQIKLDLDSDVKKEFDFKFGSVVYRANADKSCGSEPITRFDFAKDPTKVIEFIDEQITQKNCSEFKPNQGSFLRKGLSEAFSMFERNKMQKQSNYVILIGSAADETDESDDLDKIASTYAKCGVNLFAYQYMYGNHWVYENFYSDLVDMINKAQTEMASMIRSKRTFEKVKFVSNDLNYMRRFVSDTSISGFIRFAEVCGPSGGKSLNGQYFLEDMNNLVARITDFHISNIKIITQKINALITPDNKGDDGIDAAILFNYRDIPNLDEILDFFSGTGFQYVAPGWAPKSHKELREDLFLRTLFFTQDELVTLKSDLKRFSTGDDNPSVFREQAYDAMKALASNYIGESTTNTQISGKQLFDAFVGVSPSALNIFSQIEDIEDIKNARKFDVPSIKKLQQSARKWLEDLECVDNNKEYQWKRGKVVYYWVPEAVFNTEKALRCN